jgi:hypothetical protein
MSEKRTLLQRINAVQREVDYVQKEKKQGMRYSIVSHDAVTAKVRPLMVKHGIVYYPIGMQMEQVGNRTQAGMTVRFVSIDDAADFMDVCTAGYGIDDQDKGPGKAISYAVKYALLKCLGLESGDDPDQDQNVMHRNDPPEEIYPPVKSSAQQKRDGDWQKMMLELSVAIHDCKTLVSLGRLRVELRESARKQGWNSAYKMALKDELDAHEDRLTRETESAFDAETEAALLDQRMRDERAALANHPIRAG